MPGTLALVGGEEFTDGCSFDSNLIHKSNKVLVVPTALAYENPEDMVGLAQQWVSALGASVDVLEVYRRSEAVEPGIVSRVESADVVYVTSGSPMHLRSVLKDSPLLEAMIEAWRDGTTVVLAGEAAGVACSTMVDSRGGAFTVGLDVINNFTVVPRLNRLSPEKWHRTVGLASAGLPVVGIDEATALIRDPDGNWTVEGSGSVHVYLDGKEADPSILP